MNEKVSEALAECVTHYRRLIGAGYDKKEAVKRVVAYNPSFRDWLKRRKQPVNPVRTHDGEEQYDKMTTKMDSSGTQPMEPVQPTQTESIAPVVGQKVISNKDFGRVSHVGPRFISVRWLKNNRLERFGRSRFANAVQATHFVLLPQIRVAQNVKK